MGVQEGPVALAFTKILTGFVVNIRGRLIDGEDKKKPR